VACSGEAAAPERHFWERSAAIWHVVFLLGLGTATVAAYNQHGLTSARGIASFATIGTLAVWYAATGARSLHRDSARLGHLYVAGMLPLFGVLVVLDDSMGYLLFFAIPQVYIFVHRIVIASLCVAGLFTALGVTLAARHEEIRADPWSVVFPLGISMTISLIMGTWISGIIDQSTKRAGLIAELERTRAELAAERHDAGMYAERARLAAEIHDTLAQGFTSILMLTQAAETTLRRDPDATQEALTLIEGTARENLAEARSLVAALAPAALDGTTLPEALRRLAGRHERETKTGAQLAVHGTPVPDAETDVVLLRAAQETLTNVRRHAAASLVELTLGYGPDGVTLVVRDDGVGFDPSAGGGGYGLSGMRHRVEQSGGTVKVSSEPGSGTTVEVTLP
jgi:signal transduction histidine kinase